MARHTIQTASAERDTDAAKKNNQESSTEKNDSEQKIWTQTELVRRNKVTIV